MQGLSRIEPTLRNFFRIDRNRLNFSYVTPNAKHTLDKKGPWTHGE